MISTSDILAVIFGIASIVLAVGGILVSRQNAARARETDLELATQDEHQPLNPQQLSTEGRDEEAILEQEVQAHRQSANPGAVFVADTERRLELQPAANIVSAEPPPRRPVEPQRRPTQPPRRTYQLIDTSHQPHAYLMLPMGTGTYHPIIPTQFSVESVGQTYHDPEIEALYDEVFPNRQVGGNR